MWSSGPKMGARGWLRGTAEKRATARRTGDRKPEAAVTGTCRVDASSKTTGHQGPRCAPSYRTAPGRSGSRPRGERQTRHPVPRYPMTTTPAPAASWQLAEGEGEVETILFT